jgi:hypothetical protein
VSFLPGEPVVLNTASGRNEAAGVVLVKTSRRRNAQARHDRRLSRANPGQASVLIAWSDDRLWWPTAHSIASTRWLGGRRSGNQSRGGATLATAAASLTVGCGIVPGSQMEFWREFGSRTAHSDKG